MLHPPVPKLNDSASYLLILNSMDLLWVLKIIFTLYNDTYMH